MHGELLVAHRVRSVRLTTTLGQTEHMTVRPAESADPARWLLRFDVDWWDLVRYGPPGFDVYVRIAFADGAERVGEEPTLRAALATLVDHTTTPMTGFAAIWKGWTSRASVPAAPTVPIPEREMVLFAGPVDELRDAPALAWYGASQGIHQEPHIVWPDDHAWCVACEVDEEVEFTVGCSAEAFRALSRALPGVVRQVSYGEAAPLHRE